MRVARRGIALPTVLLLLALLGLMAAGTLASLRQGQRSGQLRAADAALGAAELEAVAGALDGCPEALLAASPGSELSLDATGGAVGPVSARALRLSGDLALLYGSVTDGRVGSPGAGSVRHFRIFVRLRAVNPDSGAAQPSVAEPVCVAPVESGAWGPSW